MLRARYRKILWFFGGVLADLFWWDIILPRLGLRSMSRRTRAGRLRRIAASFRTLAIQMGGVMIKVGQFLSARLDVLPREITDELSGLQDEVKPETYAVMREMIEAEFGISLEEKFSYFEAEPMAAASIGQVHRAKITTQMDLRNGGDECPAVVVKIQRPNIEQIVSTDLSALRVVGGWVNRYKPVRRRVNVPQLIAEFSRTLYEEIDYLNEGKNAETFAANFTDRTEIRVPSVCWTHTTRRVLTLEDVQSIKITDYAAIDAAGIDRAEAAIRLFDTYLKQIFEDRFFHADPHPGNLFIFPGPIPPEGEKRTWQLVFVDFGMTGKIPTKLTAGMREMLIAVGTQDANRLVRSYQMMDILLPGADLGLIERASSRVFEEFWGKSTSEMVNFSHDQAVQFAHEFGELLYDLPFQVPEDLILLGRCLGILSGMCTGLDPQFNVWATVAPYAQRLVEEEAGGNWRLWLGEAGKVVQALVSLPQRAITLLARIEKGQLEVRSPELNEQISRIDKSQRRLAGAIAFAAILIASVQLYMAGRFSWLEGAVGLALILFWLLLLR